MLHGELARAFQERARSGKVCLGIHHTAMSPQLVELYGIVRLDFVIIGSEVESLDMGRMEDMIRAADAAQTVPVVKLKRPDPNLIGEAMNAGAPMVMVPHVTTRAQLETAVRAAQFEPEGLRGECPIARYNGYGALNLAEVHEAANRSHPVIPILEDRESLDHLDELMSFEAVDIFEVGPFDLSRSLGEIGQAYNGPRTMAAIDRICEAAQRHGKAVLAPLWAKREITSYRELIQHNMDELLSRGINCIYELETSLLALHMSRLSLLKHVREVEDTPTTAVATDSKAAGTSGATRKAANGNPASGKRANGKAGHGKPGAGRPGPDARKRPSSPARR